MLTIIPNTQPHLSLISYIQDSDDSYYVSECPILGWAVQSDCFPLDDTPPSYESVQPIVFQESSTDWFVYDSKAKQAWDRHGVVFSSRDEVEDYFDRLHKGFYEPTNDAID